MHLLRHHELSFVFSWEISPQYCHPIVIFCSWDLDQTVKHRCPTGHHKDMPQEVYYLLCLVGTLLAQDFERILLCDKCSLFLVLTWTRCLYWSCWFWLLRLSFHQGKWQTWFYWRCYHLWTFWPWWLECKFHCENNLFHQLEGAWEVVDKGWGRSVEEGVVIDGFVWEVRGDNSGGRSFRLLTV